MAQFQIDRSFHTPSGKYFRVGLYETDNQEEINILEKARYAYSVKDSEKPSESESSDGLAGPPKPLYKMLKAELIDYAEHLGLEVSNRMTKDEIEVLIKEAGGA